MLVFGVIVLIFCFIHDCVSFLSMPSFIAQKSTNYAIRYNNINSRLLASPSKYMYTRKPIVTVQTIDDVLVSYTAPNKDNFISYLNDLRSDITLDGILKYPQVDRLIGNNLVSIEDINDLWISFTGEDTVKNGNLSNDEAYEFLCMILDIPDPEDIKYFQEEYQKLFETTTNGISFMKFMSWTDTQDMMQQNAVTMEDVTNLWRKTVVDLNTSLKLNDFIKLNILLDDLIEEEDSLNKSTHEVSNETETVTESSNKLIYEDIDSINVWSPDFKPESAFEMDSLQEIKQYFDANVNIDGMLSKQSFFKWSDIQELISEGTAVLFLSLNLYTYIH